MPKVPATVHPILQENVDEALRFMMNPAWSSASDERGRALGKYWGIYQRRWWPPFASGLIAFFFLVATAATFGERDLGWGFGLGAITLALIAWTVVLGRALRMRMEELAVLAPALTLTRIQRAYLEAKFVMDELALPPDTKTELDAQLDRLLDEEARLLGMQSRGRVKAAGTAEIEAERNQLRDRLSSEGDPVSREALEHGLRTCERRLVSAQSLSMAGRRIEAQLEMIAQAIGDVRDGLHRLRLAPEATGGAIELDSIRETLEHVQNHAAALEAAVEEVQSLDGRTQRTREK